MELRSLLPFTKDALFSQHPSEVDTFMNLRREMDNVFNNFMRGWGHIPAIQEGAFLNPIVEVSQSEKSLEVRAELPGVEQKDIIVEVSDSGVLTLKAERKYEKEKKDKKYYLSECAYGTFVRTIQLPFSVDPSKVNAKLENGVLIVSVPKPSEAHGKTKKIDVK